MSIVVDVVSQAVDKDDKRAYQKFRIMFFATKAGQWAGCRQDHQGAYTRPRFDKKGRFEYDFGGTFQIHIGFGLCEYRNSGSPRPWTDMYPTNYGKIFCGSQEIACQPDYSTAKGRLECKNENRLRAAVLTCPYTMY